MESDEPIKVWDDEKEALRELEADGWKIEGPFEMFPKNKDLLQVWFVGHGLTRSAN